MQKRTGINKSFNKFLTNFCGTSNTWEVYISFLGVFDIQDRKVISPTTAFPARSQYLAVMSLLLLVMICLVAGNSAYEELNQTKIAQVS